MSSNLVRVGGGSAAMVGGAIGVIASLMALVFLLPHLLTRTPNEVSSGIVTFTGLLFLLAWMLVLGGLVVLYASQREAVGGLGMVGFVMALVGTVVMVILLCIQTFHIPVSGATSIGILVGLVTGVGALVGFIGWFLFGLATFRSRIYPWPAALS